MSHRLCFFQRQSPKRGELKDGLEHVKEKKEDNREKEGREEGRREGESTD